jgi:hypothetical protein
VNHNALRLACRSHLLTLEVCTTGSTTLAATTTGYTRDSGSFVTDGFKPGMEVTPSGFVVTTPGTITAVSALALTIKDGRTTESGASGRTLTVGLPARRVWENTESQPVTGEPYVVEQYLPGPGRKITLGPLGQIEVLPQYVVQVYVPANQGTGAADGYADAILEHFAPETSITVNNATLRVRTDVIPFRGQLLQSAPGHAVVPVNIPMRLRVANTV